MSSQKKARGRLKVDIKKQIVDLIQSDVLLEVSSIDPHEVRRELQPESEKAYKRYFNTWNLYV
jgi:hypothetical protein